MPFSVNENVVYPIFGVGRITALVEKRFAEEEARLYYEVTGAHSTLWVAVDEAQGRGLRRLTRAEDLAQFRAILLARPEPLNPDFRQRQKDVRSLLQRGRLQDICEVVRDLSGRGWLKPLSSYDAEALRKSSNSLYEEWAAVERFSLAEASVEVTGLLQQARRAFRV
jgi:RNA polymerase-interacting CarD/CdnL/TRCF family regulator